MILIYWDDETFYNCFSNDDDKTRNKKRNFTCIYGKIIYSLPREVATRWEWQTWVSRKKKKKLREKCEKEKKRKRWREKINEGKQRKNGRVCAITRVMRYSGGKLNHWEVPSLLLFSFFLLSLCLVPEHPSSNSTPLQSLTVLYIPILKLNLRLFSPFILTHFNQKNIKKKTTTIYTLFLFLFFLFLRLKIHAFIINKNFNKINKFLFNSKTKKKKWKLLDS